MSEKTFWFFFMFLDFCFCFCFYLVSQYASSTTRDISSISCTVAPDYPECSNVDVSYQLYLDSGGQLVRSGVTTNYTVTLTDLQCATTYRLHLTSDRTETDYWVSITTDFPGK